MSFAETFANSATSVLSGTITSGAATLAVTGATMFPSGPQFRLLLDAELMLVTNIAGNTLTVSRGIEGTLAASHVDQTLVTHVLTSGGLVGIAGLVNVDGATATQPGTGVVGRVFFPNDGLSIYREGTSGWQPWGPIFPMTSWVDANYAWVNQGSASGSTSHGGFLISTPAGSASDNNHLRVKTIPTAPYTVTMACIPLFPFPSNFNACGICLRDSGTGKLITYGVSSDTGQWVNAQIVTIIKWTSPTVFSAFYTPTPVIASNGALLSPFQNGPCIWLQIKDDNTNRILRISSDGINFHQLHTVGRTDFITPDQIGIFANQQNATYGVSLNVLSWTESSP